MIQSENSATSTEIWLKQENLADWFAQDHLAQEKDRLDHSTGLFTP